VNGDGAAALLRAGVRAQRTWLSLLSAGVIVIGFYDLTTESDLPARDVGARDPATLRSVRPSPMPPFTLR
jgi:hypothetical protein